MTFQRRAPNATRVAPIALTIFCLLQVGALRAYELSGRRWPQAAAGEAVTLTYSYSNLLEGGLRNAISEPLTRREIWTAVEEAFALWASVAPLHFVEVPDQGGPAPTLHYPPGQYGTIRLGYRAIDGPRSVKAIANFPPASGQTDCTLCGDIHFDVDEQWETMGTLDQPDLLGAAIHEIGHTLGLGHTDVREANMFPIFRRHTGPGSGWLHPDDVAGIQAIYGLGSGSVIPLIRVPEPSSAALTLLAALICGARKYIGRASKEID